MPDTSVQIPPEAWPFIDLLFNITLVAALIWGAISLFIYLRRRALNLTPVSAARTNEQAQPDFLKVDEKARAEALQKGEAFEQKLSAQEARRSSRGRGCPQTGDDRAEGCRHRRAAHVHLHAGHHDQRRPCFKSPAWVNSCRNIHRSNGSPR